MSFINHTNQDNIFKEDKIPEEAFKKMREANLSRWPTGRDVDFDSAVERQKSLPDHKKLSVVMRKSVAEGRCLVQPRGGFGTFSQHKELMEIIDKEGLADIVPTTTDSYTRNEQFALAQNGIEESEKNVSSAEKNLQRSRVKKRAVLSFPISIATNQRRI